MAFLLSNDNWMLHYFVDFKISYLKYAESIGTVESFSKVILFRDHIFHKQSFNRYQTDIQPRTHELKT